PQLKWGMLAIFVYVGVEVSIQSNMGDLLRQQNFGGYEVSEIGRYIALYWGSLMIGRWTGALSAFRLSKAMRTILTFIIPAVAFSLILFVIHLRGNETSDLYIYVIGVLLLVAGIFSARENPSRMLFIFSILGLCSMLVGLFTEGKTAMFAFISGGLWCSIGWPCIFAMSITGLGKYAGQGSAFLIMMIVGGAIIPPLQGWIADNQGIHISYWVTVFCFLYLAWFALKAGSILKAQGFDIGRSDLGSH
ncbi:MAG: MFS transporter, partial [Crocinitomicaceae bacterium]|nr:MFS transporter [Crocinitomicaceae bacterium]